MIYLPLIGAILLLIFFYFMGLWEEKNYTLVKIPKQHYKVSKLQHLIRKYWED